MRHESDTGKSSTEGRRQHSSAQPVQHRGQLRTAPLDHQESGVAGLRLPLATCFLHHGKRKAAWRQARDCGYIGGFDCNSETYAVRGRRPSLLASALSARRPKLRNLLPEGSLDVQPGPRCLANRPSTRRRRPVHRRDQRVAKEIAVSTADDNCFVQQGCQQRLDYLPAESRSHARFAAPRSRTFGSRQGRVVRSEYASGRLTT